MIVAVAVVDALTDIDALPLIVVVPVHDSVIVGVDVGVIERLAVRLLEGVRVGVHD